MIDLQEMSVLIVDDMPSMSKFIYKMMRNIGYGKDFFFANSGKEALDILNNENVDLVLLDYNMPDMTGNKVLANIRDDRNLRDMPVVMITAEAYSDFVAEIGEAEIDAYILKPITMHILEERIKNVVEKVNNPTPMTYHLKKARDFEEMGDFDSADIAIAASCVLSPSSARRISPNVLASTLQSTAQQPPLVQCRASTGEAHDVEV